MEFYEYTIDEEGNGSHLIKSTSLEETQSPVSGFCYARNRVCNAIRMILGFSKEVDYNIKKYSN